MMIGHDHPQHRTEAKIFSVFRIAWAATYLVWSGLAAAHLQAAELEAEVRHARPPNVIVLLVDDQGYGDLSCHGNPVLKTPHLDRLHDESVRLTDFHVNPFCAPTRAALLTGRVSDRVGVRRTLNMRNYLRAGECTLGEIFQTNGYRTALVGKWHLGHNYPYRPMDRGFEEWFGIGDCGLAATSDYWGNDRFDDHYLHNGDWEAEPGFNTDVFFDRAMEFMRQKDERPFLLYLATNVPHFPWNVRPEWLEAFSGNEWPTDLDKFYASITRVDWNVGRLLKFLEEQGLAQNTIVVFATDNGTAHPENIYNAGMRGTKGSVYEGGHRVPCFVRWPEGKLGPPRDISELAAHFDLLPTLAELAGIKLPATLELDGQSLVPLLRQTGQTWRHRPWVLHSQNNEETPVKWKNSVVLDSHWRLINGRELYHLEIDPAQKRNLAASHTDVVARLREVYEANWEACGLGEFQPFERPLLGTTNQPVLELGADAWILDPPQKQLWWQGVVARGEAVHGFWPIAAEAPGDYHVEVRRWPALLNVPLTGVPPAHVPPKDLVEEEMWRMPAYQPLPVAAVCLEINGRSYTNAVAANAAMVPFEVLLEGGPATVRATLLDQHQKAIAGAYYVDIHRRAK
ncbi:MAG: arylsulfatase [Verrucomicrobia bacterium]|nr:arylsulfatase [Verrucomicrobiota bacterium]